MSDPDQAAEEEDDGEHVKKIITKLYKNVFCVAVNIFIIILFSEWRLG